MSAVWKKVPRSQSRGAPASPGAPSQAPSRSPKAGERRAAVRCSRRTPVGAAAAARRGRARSEEEGGERGPRGRARRPAPEVAAAGEAGPQGSFKVKPPPGRQGRLLGPGAAEAFQGSGYSRLPTIAGWDSRGRAPAPGSHRTAAPAGNTSRGSAAVRHPPRCRRRGRAPEASKNSAASEPFSIHPGSRAGPRRAAPAAARRDGSGEEGRRQVASPQQGPSWSQGRPGRPRSRPCPLHEPGRGRRLLAWPDPAAPGDVGAANRRARQAPALQAGGRCGLRRLRRGALPWAGTGTVLGAGERALGRHVGGRSGPGARRPWGRFLICFCRYLRWFTFRFDLPGLLQGQLDVARRRSMKLSRSRVASRPSPLSAPASLRARRRPGLLIPSKQQPLSRAPKAPPSPSRGAPEAEGDEGVRAETPPGLPSPPLRGGRGAAGCFRPAARPGCRPGAVRAG